MCCKTFMLTPEYASPKAVRENAVEVFAIVAKGFPALGPAALCSAACSLAVMPKFVSEVSASATSERLSVFSSLKSSYHRRTQLQRNPLHRLYYLLRLEKRT